MPQYTGTVEVHSSKGGRHSLKMDDGNWYGCFRDDPKVEAGQVCKFDWEWDKTEQYRNVVKGSVRIKPGSEPTPRNKTSGGGSKDDYWNKKFEFDQENQKRISYQAATNTAVAMVSAGFANDLFPTPKKNGWDVFSQLVIDTADTIYDRYQAIGTNATASAQEEQEEVPEQQEEDGNEEW